MKVLIISYYWPPSGGSGVQRWMYFAKYLGEFGIEPTVITVDEKYASYSSTDESLNDKIKHVRVFKTKTLEPLRFYSFLKSGNAKKEIPQGNVGGKKKGLIDKLATYVRGNFFIPDARVGWNRYAFAQASKLIQSENFDIVITTGPPHSTHLVGLKLKEKFNIKWMADFRDPWTEVYYNELFKRTRKNDLRDKNLELSVLQNADCVLTVGPSMKVLLEGKLVASTTLSILHSPPMKVDDSLGIPRSTTTLESESQSFSKLENDRDKVKFIYNGYDSEKLTGIERIKNARFTICYVGTLSANYPYQSFIAALKKMIDQQSTWEVTVKLVGKMEEDVISAFQTIPKIELTIYGNVPHQKALEIMVNADLLLLILPVNEGSKIIVSGKLLEYIACNVPILGILNIDSDAADLIEKYAQGKAFLPQQIEEISAFISEVKNNELKPKENLGDFRDFDRRNTAKQLSVLLHQF